MDALATANSFLVELKLNTHTHTHTHAHTERQRQRETEKDKVRERETETENIPIRKSNIRHSYQVYLYIWECVPVYV